jgi:ribosomal protein S18 acetylase RimI-like enzyme
VRAEEEFIVRRATSKDAEGIVNVLKSAELGDEAWNGNEQWVKKTLQKFLRNEAYLVLVAEHDHKVVGFIDCLVFPSFWEGSSQGLINHLFMHADFQGKEIGARLVEAIVKRVDAEGIGEMHVSTGWNNTKARRLYAKYGFTEERLLLERSREV